MKLWITFTKQHTSPFRLIKFFINNWKLFLIKANRLIQSIYNSQEIPNKFIAGVPFLFINNNIYYLYYTKIKNVYKIANLNQYQFSLEEVNIRKGFQIIYGNLNKLINEENNQKRFLKYSLKSITKPESYYCIN